jgi:AcrR family transcriptional regulator
MVRPRSIEAHEKVLNAALELFAERGIETTSMDAISQASGVSKATIYNHWSDKEALLLEAMLMVHGLDREPEEIDTGDVQRDLTTVLTRKPPDKYDAVRNRLTPSLIAYSAFHPEFGREWRHRVTEPPRQCIKKILRSGISRGQLSADLDIEASVALLLGPVLYAHIFNKEDPSRAPDLGPVSAASFWRAHSQNRKEQIKKIAVPSQSRKQQKPKT